MNATASFAATDTKHPHKTHVSGVSGQGKRRGATTQSSPAVSSKRLVPRSLEARSEEAMTVHAGITSANGVTNTTPGGGMMGVQRAPRSQSTVTRDYLAKQSPTANINELISAMPGVAYQSQDIMGATGDALSMRGMNETEVGYLFEGAPVADAFNYEPFTSTYVDNENIGSITVAQGSPDLTAPLYNTVGGQISAKMIDPSHKMGGYLDLMGGNYSVNKEFVRFDTGDIGHSGIRGFLSFSNTHGHMDRGFGVLRRYHTDAKFVKEWGKSNSFGVVFSYTRLFWNSVRRPSMAQWKEYGRSFNFNEEYTPGDTAYYKFQTKNRNGITIVAPLHLDLGSGLSFNATPYFVLQYSPATGASNLSADGSYYGTEPAGPLNQPYTVNGKVTAMGIGYYNAKNSGLTTSLDWKRGNNTLSFGYWYSYATHWEENSYSTVDLNGNVANMDGKYPIILQNGKVLRGYNLNLLQQTNALFLSDRLNLLKNRLHLEAGIKAAMVSRQATEDMPGADPYKSVRNYFEPLPQVAASFDITQRDQVYFNATTAFRVPGSSETQVQDFDPSSPTAVSQPGSLKPEYTIGEEIGFRHHGLYNVSASLFNLNLTNHQVTSSGYIAGTTTLIDQTMNVGGETVRGAQVEFGLQPWHHFSPYVSGQYLDARIDNNYQVGSDYLHTKGKTAVQSPHFTASLGLSYDDGRFFGNFQLRYLSSQYATFMNDEKMPGYVVANTTLGYRIAPKLGIFKHPQIQLNMQNMGGNNYLSGIAGVTANARSYKGIYGTTISGSSPNYNVGSNFGIMASISTGL